MSLFLHIWKILLYPQTIFHYDFRLTVCAPQKLVFCTVSERCIIVPSQWGTKSLSLTFNYFFSAGGMTCPIRSKQLSLFSHLQEMVKDASLPTALQNLTLPLFLFYLLVLFVFIIKPWPSNTNTLFYFYSILVFFLFIIKMIKSKCK